MWICLNDAFFSIVASDRDPTVLAVRTRRDGDLEAYFPGYPPHAWPGHDYAFRAFIPREVVVSVIAERIQITPYTNFKASVDDERLHDAYLKIWSVMVKLQRKLQQRPMMRLWGKPPVCEWEESDEVYDLAAIEGPPKTNPTKRYR